MTDLLFNGGYLSDALRAQGQKMRDEINSLDENRILNTSEEDLCNYFVEKYKVEALQIDESQIQTDYSDAEIDVSRRWDYDYTGHVTGTRITYYIPFTGDRNLFKLQPSHFNFNPPRADVRDNEIEMIYDRTTL